MQQNVIGGRALDIPDNDGGVRLTAEIAEGAENHRRRVSARSAFSAVKSPTTSRAGMSRGAPQECSSGAMGYSASPHTVICHPEQPLTVIPSNREGSSMRHS